MADPMAEKILLVEDTPSLAMMYSTLLERAGYQVEIANTFVQGVAAYNREKPAVALVDLMLPDGDGNDLVAHIFADNPSCEVIVITANGSINRAVQAMRAGAFDFLVKPFADNRLISSVESALTKHSRAVNAPQTSNKSKVGFHGFIGTSPQMQQIYDQLDNIGRSTATVFISGESGTGKEVCAQTIHDLSNRAKGPFIPLNCGAIPRDLLESEVFGHLKGSFTGAIADKLGAAEAADGGTLFLDEICEMDLSLQTKLLRFLQTSSIQPVGATTPRLVDVRIVCATNRDPLEQVRLGLFREDLYYRLHVVPLHLPPLRDRGDDVLEIANVLLAQINEEEGKSFQRLSAEITQIFRTHSWPGNVRQLLNVLRNVVVLNDAVQVDPHMLPHDFNANLRKNTAFSPATAHPPLTTQSDPVQGQPANVNTLVGQRLADVERELIEATIAHCNGSIPKAAHMLDVSASTIYRKRETWAREAKNSLSA